MAEGGTDRLTLLNWPTLLTCVLFSWGIVLLPPAMKSLRPAGEPPQATGPPVGQVFESRLWQDPFDCVRAARKSGVKLLDVQRALFKESDKDLCKLILPVFLPGSEYPEDVEIRLRSRYAVVSALAVSGYIPEDGGDIRCFSIPWPISEHNSLLHAFGGLSGLGRGAPNPPNSEVFPYEWFQYVPRVRDPGSYQESLTELTHIILDPEAKPPKRIAVIWVDELLFDEARVGRGPATLLKEWARHLKEPPNVDLAILGPQSSTTLRALLLETKPIWQWCRAAADKIKIYSFSSTVAALRRPLNQKPMQADDFDIEHVIGTDRELADMLVHELNLRGIEASPHEKTVALVAEWDTFYSQSMVNAFSQAFHNDGLRFFTYLQGIDGRLPRDRAPDEAGTQKQAASGSALQGGEPLEDAPEVQSFGRSQIDYLQRLVDQMKRTSPRGWKAIGVLGSDFYDKALILQTLKHEFPESVFFTTDLDQRFLDPAEHKTTRNLLVASHFGLKLHYGLQRAIPPFRSVYQTALFLGCLKAVRARGVPPPCILADDTFMKAFSDKQIDGHPLVHKTSPAGPALVDPLWIKWNPDAKDNEPTLKPMVFEIGLSRAYPLTDPGPEEIHPATYRRTHSFVLKEVFKEVFGVVVCLVIGLLALVAISLGLPPKNKVGLWFVLWVICAVLAVAAMIFLAIHDHQDYEGEPFTLLEGISTWPTALLRLGVALFCIFALIQSQQADTQNSEQLTDQFELGVGSAVLEFQRFWEWATSFRISYLAMEENKTDPRPMWARYRWLSLPSRRAARVIGWVVVYVVLCWLFRAILELELPNHPYRGTLNKWTDRVILYIAALLAISLFWYVVDANRLCIRLIHLLADHNVVWPEKAWKTAAAISGLDFRSLKSEDSKLQDTLTRSLNRLTTMVILANRTEIIGRLMYYSALAFLLLFLARSPFFDQYAWSYFLFLIYTTALLGVFCCSAWLRYSAKWAKRDAVVKVREEVIDLRLAMSTREQGHAEAEASATLEEIAKAISKVRKGAFSRLGDDPVLHTFLMILGGIGAVLSLEPIQHLLR